MWKNPGSLYVEGIAIKRGGSMHFQHAWVTFDGSDAMDPTLDAAEYEYMGVAFDDQMLASWLGNTYGLLCPELMFKIDPELMQIEESIVNLAKK